MEESEDEDRSWGVGDGDQRAAASTLSSSSSASSAPSAPPPFVEVVEVEEVTVTQAKRPAAAAAATVATTTAPKRAKAKHSDSDSNVYKKMSFQDLVAHFQDTVEVTGKNGNKKFTVVCTYCAEAYNQYQARMQLASARQRFFSTPVAKVGPPKRIHRTHRDLSGHLYRCKYTAKARRDSESGKSVNTALSGKTPVVQKSMEAFAIPGMTQPEIHLFQKRFVVMLVDAALPLSHGDRESCKQAFNAVRPGSSLHLPGRTKATRLLHELADHAAADTNARSAELLSEGHFSGFLIDTWQNASKVHIDGLLLKAGASTFAVESSVAESEHHGIAVARGWELLVRQRLSTDPKFRYFLSDDAGQCGRARRILALRFPSLVFLKCFAHQINLMVKALLGLPQFKAIMEQATASVNAMNASSSKWLPKFRDKAERLYGKRAANTLIAMGETRWNSAQACFASLLRVRSACQLFAAEKKVARDFPLAVTNAWTSDEFWKGLEEAEHLIQPFCEASFLLQRESNTLAHVLLVFMNLYRHIKVYSKDSAVAEELWKDIKKRWNKEEHPLFFLAFLVHPEFASLARDILKNSKRRSKKNNPLSASRLLHAAKFYYQKHHLFIDEENKVEELRHLARQLNFWIAGKAKIDIHYDPKEDYDEPSSWWIQNENSSAELSRFSCFLLDCPVQAASCERMFKDMSRQSTKGRNRLLPETIHAQTIVLHHLRREREDSNPDQHQVKKNRHVNPIEHERMDLSSPTRNTTADSSDEEEIQDNEEDQEEIDEDETALVNGSIFSALSQLLDDDDDDDDDDEAAGSISMDSDSHSNADAGTDDDDEDYSNEHPFESVDINDLVSLPEVNDPKYPQEDAKYFRRKNYVRKDKYELSWFFPQQEEDIKVEIPQLLDVFSKAKG